MQRPLAFLAALVTTACIWGAAPARAESYPVCLTGGEINAMQCDYATLAQCDATASGGLGYCVANPDYVAGAYASARNLHRRMR